ncbi:uncharacterized protein [Rutidosis leptorrhynchoides]|uniref:uncharacterized protein n=1 Tax=Rutidosis leptorrhynchoides TaxID=125765 RepID=UPI003A98F278
MSFNIRGFGGFDGVDSKVGWFRKMCIDVRPDIVAIQESRCNEVNDNWVEIIWGNSNFRYLQKPKVEKSGGMLLIWDPSVFVVDDAVGKDHFLAIKGSWRGKDRQCIIVNVYGPHKDRDKKKFWDSLDQIMNIGGVDWVIGGDFNEVRAPEERQNCIFSERRAKLFNRFIDDNHLIDVPLTGKRFTRISDDGKKFSKIDRFLVSEGFLQAWGDISVTSFDRKTSDHSPMLLCDNNIDFGPKPFKLFDIWLENKEVESIIIEAWNKTVTNARPDCFLRDRLKNVKNSLREWSKIKYGALDSDLIKYKMAVEQYEEKADLGIIDDQERLEWLNARACWLQKDKEKTCMLKQKARLKWAAEGDDNTSFFYSTIRRNNCRTNIRGLYIDGCWE